MEMLGQERGFEGLTGKGREEGSGMAGRGNLHGVSWLLVLGSL